MFIELNSFDGCLSNLGHFCFRNRWFVVIQGIQLAVEGFHGLHVDGAEAPSPAAEEEAATALGGERGPGVAARPRGGGAAKAGAGGEGLPQGQRGPGMAARAGGAPVWGTQALPGRADGGGAGPRRLLSAPLGLVRPPSVPVPPTLHPLPPSDSSFTSPPLGPQEPPDRKSVV